MRPIPFDKRESVVSMLLATMDIEQLSANNTRPNVTNPADVIPCISLRLQYEGEEKPVHRCLFALGHAHAIPHVTNYLYDNEEDLLAGFCEYITTYADPDVLQGPICASPDADDSAGVARRRLRDGDRLRPRRLSHHGRAQGYAEIARRAVQDRVRAGWRQLGNRQPRACGGPESYWRALC